MAGKTCHYPIEVILRDPWREDITVFGPVVRHLPIFPASPTVASPTYSSLRRGMTGTVLRHQLPQTSKPDSGSASNLTFPFPLATILPILGTNTGLGARPAHPPLIPHLRLRGARKGQHRRYGEPRGRVCAHNTIGRRLPTPVFKYKETVKIISRLPRFMRAEDRKLALYDTSSGQPFLIRETPALSRATDKGVVIPEIRRFEEVDKGAAAQVSEIIDDQCPTLLQLITQTTARKAHKEDEPVPHALRATFTDTPNPDILAASHLENTTYLQGTIARLVEHDCGMYEGLRVCARIQSLDAKEEREDAGQKELSRREDVIVAAVNDACGSGDACETEALQRAIERWNTIVTPNLYVALPGGGGSTQCYIATGYLCCGPGLYVLKRCFQMEAFICGPQDDIQQICGRYAGGKTDRP
ncbi:hypothetical protein B0H17DRAFT_1150478 [Mycena rosella]|uniref:Uncharacterized protein n=1 Tax=Mycena rosella TaxID=1033263 RepID=A0AAD7BT44_MYCRO|nr:hypothetical protein B0H17DRAFT_1150478 [Mycena rosella]